METQLRIGISGWRYEPWRGTFYPKELRQADELAFVSRQLNFDEINGTFYSLQRASSFQAWHDATPEDFMFSVKGPRYLTHMLRLKNVEIPLANFLASGVLLLERKLGPFLWQFPPNFQYDPSRMQAFFDLLPRTMRAARKLAQQHDHHVKTAALGQSPDRQPLRHAVEIRHPSFATQEFVAQLREANIALVNADTAGKWPVLEDVTADFCYIRLHGDAEIYASGYDDAALDRWAQKIRAWAQGREPAHARRVAKKLGPQPPRDVFVAFDNDLKVRAPVDAIHLSQRLGLQAGAARENQTIAPALRTRTTEQ